MHIDFKISTFYQIFNSGTNKDRKKHQTLYQPEADQPTAGIPQGGLSSLIFFLVLKKRVGS